MLMSAPMARALFCAISVSSDRASQTQLCSTPSVDGKLERQLAAAREEAGNARNAEARLRSMVAAANQHVERAVAEKLDAQEETARLRQELSALALDPHDEAAGRDPAEPATLAPAGRPAVEEVLQRVSPVNLAYVGDSVYDAALREHFLWPPARVNKLAARVRELTCAAPRVPQSTPPAWHHPLGLPPCPSMCSIISRLPSHCQVRRGPERAHGPPRRQRLADGGGARVGAPRAQRVGPWPDPRVRKGVRGLHRLRGARRLPSPHGQGAAGRAGRVRTHAGSGHDRNLLKTVMSENIYIEHSSFFGALLYAILAIGTRNFLILEFCVYDYMGIWHY